MDRSLPKATPLFWDNTNSFQDLNNNFLKFNVQDFFRCFFLLGQWNEKLWFNKCSRKLKIFWKARPRFANMYAFTYFDIKLYCNMYLNKIIVCHRFYLMCAWGPWVYSNICQFFKANDYLLDACRSSDALRILSYTIFCWIINRIKAFARDHLPNIEFNDLASTNRD